MSDILKMKSKKEICDYEENVMKEQVKFIKEVVSILKTNNSKYWLNRILKTKTISGQYDICKKLDLTRKTFA